MSKKSVFSPASLLTPLDKKKKKWIIENMDWLLDNWQLLASALLAIVNLIITLCVHGSSRSRITALEDKDGDGIPDDLEKLIQINKDLLEKLKKDEETR